MAGIKVLMYFEDSRVLSGLKKYLKHHSGDFSEFSPVFLVHGDLTKAISELDTLSDTDIVITDVSSFFSLARSMLATGKGVKWVSSKLIPLDNQGFVNTITSIINDSFGLHDPRILNL